MPVEVLQVIDPGLGATLQDRGRWGWRRFGVPISGAMDDHAAAWANHLLNNPEGAPVLELLLQGAKLIVLRNCWVAITGADASVNLAAWRSIRVSAGETIHFAQNRRGVWSYLAVEGGFQAGQMLGSASFYPRGNLGQAVAAEAKLSCMSERSFQLVSGVSGRFADPKELRDYAHPPVLRVWPGPQWHEFTKSDREHFFAAPWTVTPQSDRVGYRLAGSSIQPAAVNRISEPTRPGTIQIPESGQPIVLMRDGPAVGGYAKIGMIDPEDLSWMAQCRPGQAVRFTLVQ